MADEARTLTRLNQPPPPRGILRAPPPDGVLEGRRLLPSPKLAAHVHHFWMVRWALRSPFVPDTLPHPAGQIVCFDAALGRRTEALGVQTGRVTRRLVDEGWMFGITFRPAMFQPLLGASMASLTDRVVSLDAVLGAKSKAFAPAIQRAAGVDDRMAIAEAFLAPLLPQVSPRLARLRDLVERMASDRTIIRMEGVVEASGLDARALQRCFQTYVGVSPKWVIQRYRLHEAVAQLAGPHPPSLAALAASLGYADQAHFGRDFKRAVGETPRAFERVSGARAVNQTTPPPEPSAKGTRLLELPSARGGG